MHWTLAKFGGGQTVEEKFGEQNFRVLSEMRGKNLYIDPKIQNFGSKIDENAETDSAKF